MKKRWKIIIVVLILVFVLMVSVKTLSGEDDWICVKGEWVKHGYPSAEKPQGACEESFFQRMFEAGS